MLKVLLSLATGTALAVLAIYGLSLIFTGWTLFTFQIAACFLAALATLTLLETLA